VRRVDDSQGVQTGDGTIQIDLCTGEQPRGQEPLSSRSNLGFFWPPPPSQA
jgi:hypothetical protein